MAPSHRRSRGELESEVLAALWAGDEALTPTDIQERIGGGLAYNTVHTIVSRLLDKGLIVRDNGTRRGAYRPAKSLAQTTAEAMHRALDQDPDPIASLQHFVTGLDDAETRALRHILDGKPPR